jgi:hypothetical protein
MPFQSAECPVSAGNTMKRSYNFYELEILDSLIPDFKKSFAVVNQFFQNGSITCIATFQQ